MRVLDTQPLVEFGSDRRGVVGSSPCKALSDEFDAGTGVLPTQLIPRKQ